MTAAPLPEAISVHDLVIRYPYATQDAVGAVSFALRQGERVLLLGPSGCGKSSILHALTGLLPQSIPATRGGALQIFGEDVTSRSPSEWADQIAFLFQDAEQTLAGFTVADEVAFALENRNYPPDKMAAAINDAMSRAGIPQEWSARRTATLSGGQKQMVALAATLAQGSALIILDEPTASLAPQAAKRLAEQVLGLGRTALIVDHSLGALLDRIDRVIVLNPSGKLLIAGTTDHVFAEHGARLVAQGIWTPPAVRLRLRLMEAGHVLSKLWRMSDLLAHLPPDVDLAPLLLPAPARPGPELVRLEGAACAPPFGPVVLRDISISLRAGEVLGILGPNGAGKSTLAACLAGLAPLRDGQRHGPAGAIAFQNAEAHFTTDSTRGELAALGLSSERISQTLADWGLSEQADQHPFTLSMGQKRRLALALLTETDRWPLLILDEPTTGLDWRATVHIATQIQRLAASGRALAVITHDAEFALSVCHRIVLLDQGGVAAMGPAPEILCDAPLLDTMGLAPPDTSPLLRRMEAAPC